MNVLSDQTESDMVNKMKDLHRENLDIENIYHHSNIPSTATTRTEEEPAPIINKRLVSVSTQTENYDYCSASTQKGDGSPSACAKNQSDLGCDTCHSEKHIMFSYNQKERPDLVMMIKTKLEERGHKVWMDKEQLYKSDSTLQAMAKGVDNSKAFLMFHSAAYKASHNCRAEAEYAFEKRKRIVPVQMESGYQPDGWLGMIIGTRLRYNLAKHCKRDTQQLVDMIDELSEGNIT